MQNRLKHALKAYCALALAVCAVSSTAQTPAAAQAKPKVMFETNLGNFTIELEPQAAPASVANFLQYVKSKHYDGTIFHRVIPGFVAQGGGFDEKMRQKPTRDPIRNEAKNGLKNTLGTLAMARTGDPNSATSQFFINLKDNTSLDYPSFDGWGYAVFGRVTQGMEVVNKMAEQPTGNVDGMGDVPLKPIVVRSAHTIN